MFDHIHWWGANICKLMRRGCKSWFKLLCLLHLQWYPGDEESKARRRGKESEERRRKSMHPHLQLHKARGSTVSQTEKWKSWSAWERESWDCSLSLSLSLARSSYSFSFSLFSQPVHLSRACVSHYLSVSQQVDRTKWTSKTTKSKNK